MKCFTFLVVLLSLTSLSPARAEIITSIDVRDGVLYQGTATGLILREAQKPETLLYHYTRRQDFYDRAQDRRGDLLERPAFEHMPPHVDITETVVETDSTDVLAGNHVVGVAHDGAGRLWVASRLHGVVRREAAGIWRHISAPTMCPLVGILAYQKEIWVIPSCGGAALYTDAGWKGYEGGIGDVGTPSSSGAVVSNGKLYLALAGGGIATYDGDTWKQRTFLEARHNWPTLIAADALGLWTYVERDGTGLLRIEGDELSYVPIDSKLEVVDIAVHPKHGLLVAGRDAVWKLEGDKLVAFSDAPFGGALYQGPDALWIGGRKGLVRLRAKGGATIYERNEESGSDAAADGDLLALIQVVSAGRHDTYEGEILFQRQAGVCKVVARGALFEEFFESDATTVECSDLETMYGELDVGNWSKLDDFDHAGGAHVTSVVLRTLEPSSEGQWTTSHRTFALDISAGDSPHMRHVQTAYAILERQGLKKQK